MLANNETKIIANCANMDYISSSGLRVFLMTLKKIKGAGGKLVICALQDNIKEIFDISGFSNFFEMFASQEEALKVF